jgi:hypothetical protein
MEAKGKTLSNKKGKLLMHVLEYATLISVDKSFSNRVGQFTQIFPYNEKTNVNQIDSVSFNLIFFQIHDLHNSKILKLSFLISRKQNKVSLSFSVFPEWVIRDWLFLTPFQSQQLLAP